MASLAFEWPRSIDMLSIRGSDEPDPREALRSVVGGCQRGVGGCQGEPQRRNVGVRQLGQWEVKGRGDLHRYSK